MTVRLHELEPDTPEMRRLLALAGERVVEHLASLAQQPAADVEGADDVALSLREPSPEGGVPFEELLALLFERAVPKSFNAAGPGYLAYIPGGGLFVSALGDLIADAVNRYTGLWVPAPALVQLEANVLRWFAELVGYPGGSGGILTSGGSLANFSALVAARRARLPENFLAGTLYASDQVHHSVQKAALLCGFPERNLREVESDDCLRLRHDRLEAQVRADRAAGLVPFLLVANGGSTNTGAVDDLEALADFSARQGLWLHVDAAYGGFFALCERGRQALRGLSRADSITLDPHKGLFLPYGSGALLVREAALLRQAHSLHADYLPAVQEDLTRTDFAELSPELSRPYRGLRAWLPLKLYGWDVFRRALDEKLDLARAAERGLRAIPGIEVVTPTQLTVVTFKLAEDGAPPEQADARNRELLERVNARKRVFLSGTLLRGRLVMPLGLLSFRTPPARVPPPLEHVQAALGELG
jgi:aromatic-L-amino-acid decarboxylase